jgi:hypothetical protein
MSLLKRFVVTEKDYFQLRFEAFNVVNHLEVRADYKPGESAAPFS